MRPMSDKPNSSPGGGVGVFLFIVLAWAGMSYYFNDSGWYPRTREVTIFAEAAKWVPGELKFCFSSEDPTRSELTSLECDSDTGESHLLNVQFWGTITTERPKVWKCEREETSLICKLQ